MWFVVGIRIASVQDAVHAVDDKLFDTLLTLDFRTRHPVAEQPVDQRKNILLCKDRLGQVLVLAIVKPDDVRVTKQPLKAVHAGIDEDVTLRLVVMVALAEHRVEIVPQKPEPRIFNASIHRVVIACPVGKAAFPVAQQRIDGQKSHPFLKIDDLADLSNKAVIRNVIVIEFIDKAEQVRPVVLSLVCFFDVVVSIVVGIWRLTGTFFVVKVGESSGSGKRTVVIISASIKVAGVVIREMIFCPVTVENFYSGIRTICLVEVVCCEVLTVDSELHNLYVRCGQTSHLEQYTAHEFKMRVFAVNVQCRDVFPRMVVREIYAIAHWRIGPLAVAPVADADVIANVCVYAVNADERSVHLCVAHRFGGKQITAVVPVPDVLELHQFLLGHYQVIKRLAVGDPSFVRAGRIVHLVERICHLLRPSVDHAGSGPCTGIGAGIGCFEIELHDCAIGLCRYSGRVEAVARIAVTVLAVVKHR